MGSTSHHEGRESIEFGGGEEIGIPSKRAKSCAGLGTSCGQEEKIAFGSQEENFSGDREGVPHEEK